MTKRLKEDRENKETVDRQLDRCGTHRLTERSAAV